MSNQEVNAKVKFKPSLGSRIERFILLLASRIGPSGVVLFLFVSIYLEFAKPEQKRFLFETLVLNKNSGEDIASYIIFAIVVLFFFVLWFYYHSRIKLDKEHIDDITEEKNRLQSMIIENQRKEKLK